MKNEMLFWTAIMIVSIFLAAVSQILLKISANSSYSGVLYEYLNLKVISAYVLLFITTILAVLALRYVPLYVAASIEAVSQVFVCVLGKVVLKEKVNVRKKTGMLIIIAGIAMVCL